jgi:hypothetical protein
MKKNSYKLKLNAETLASLSLDHNAHGGATGRPGCADYTVGCPRSANTGCPQGCFVDSVPGYGC